MHTTHINRNHNISDTYLIYELYFEFLGNLKLLISMRLWSLVYGLLTFYKLSHVLLLHLVSGQICVLPLPLGGWKSCNLNSN